MTKSSLNDLEVKQYNQLGTDSVAWENILAKNAVARGDDAEFIENRSFSAGAAYTNTMQWDTLSSRSIDVAAYVENEFTIGLKLITQGLGIWADSEAGGMVNFKINVNNATRTDTGNTTQIGYHLADNDLGDFMSVDILKDTSYGTPAFRLVSGTTSCPPEPGSQSRDQAQISLNKPVINNVPLGESATFVANLTNLSPSRETREYEVRVISTSNPDGAIVRLGGQIINNGPAAFFLDYNNPSNVVLTVERGPYAAEYENIAIMMYPGCEYDLWQNNGNVISGDTAYFTVRFQSECSSIALVNPGDNWIINQASNNQLLTTFGGYDRNNSSLEFVALQYRFESEGWVDAYSVEASELVQNFYDRYWDVSGLPDGNYQLRAKAYCGQEKGFTYSSIASGIIDRNSLAPFGYPSPSDGYLRLGQVISVEFDKAINCNFLSQNPTYTPVVTLVRDDNGAAIPFTLQCSGQVLNIIPNDNLFEIPELRGVSLTAHVDSIRDLSGNIQEYATDWSFLVNTSPVFWDPAEIDESALTGSNAVLSGTLKNGAVITKVFELSYYPTWLEPSSVGGAILSANDYTIEFKVNPDLPPGIYTDTVVAMVDGNPEKLPVRFELLAIPPNWQANSADYNYSMNLVMQFSRDQGNALLSTDERDMIAAFVDGQVRGTATMTYLPATDSYVAFLTVYSNDAGGNGRNSNSELIRFRFWHALSGVEYGAVETETFVNDKIVGTVPAPMILHPAGVVQVIPLKKGWNWVSFNVDVSNMTREQIFESILSPAIGNEVIIKRKDGQTATYAANATWNGNLTDFDNNNGYLLNLSVAPDTLRLVGVPLSTPSTIALTSGWNWIGFQPQEAQTIQASLSSLNQLRDGDLIKSQESFSTWYGNAWNGTLQFLQPGKAYKLNLDRNNNSLNYALRTGEGELSYDHSEFESSLTLIGVSGLQGIDKRGLEQLQVVAFVEGECRGIGSFEYVAELGQSRIIMSVHGNPDEIGNAVEFRLYDPAADEFLASSDAPGFVAEGLLGSVSNPYKLFDGITLTLQPFLSNSYPNPFERHTSLAYYLPQAEAVTLKIVDQNGRTIDVLENGRREAGKHELRWNAPNLPAGIYQAVLSTGSGYVQTVKMVKM
ncbi:MAG: T9SS type A sorting domain-containing protein [Bacteroidia bacterium]